ncbi:hypothetical protein R2325_16355 [Mycobacteroides chelonae]|jgi:hypothetical protein|uniref:hypothetical protein n=1 Tax=Mycobacteroides TaxID=670516 RepID=UPI00092AF9BE|nr:MULTISPECIES: hypothetical protein [Mycobacteroides]MBV6360426.1 hypothetical protein [Mycobacteroides chelonae]MEC4857147.1 hypothetical protein [Mycobacteroides chelonae]MEC4873557.1 hypothetical protein [Mycobacteroides chelonae]SHW93506.1 Uncharacterised protein [Mycobacteroides abscessus subsp. abscessus]SKL81201.1 Uncharacterised protein [Mycobacteroides abscessus subsp. abscessus]
MTRRFGKRVRRRIRLGSHADQYCVITGKVKHPTPEAAEEALQTCRKKRKAQHSRRMESRHYFCLGCGEFHLTSEQEGT